MVFHADNNHQPFFLGVELIKLHVVDLQEYYSTSGDDKAEAAVIWVKRWIPLPPQPQG
ncbi:hypothetical protein C5167_029992 [Papaver somniferum]|nr:hypothetical protein C5167_029992 [Papaver somniferum]